MAKPSKFDFKDYIRLLKLSKNPSLLGNKNTSELFHKLLDYEKVVKHHILLLNYRYQILNILHDFDLHGISWFQGSPIFLENEILWIQHLIDSDYDDFCEKILSDENIFFTPNEMFSEFISISESFNLMSLTAYDFNPRLDQESEKIDQFYTTIYKEWENFFGLVLELEEELKIEGGLDLLDKDFDQTID